MLKVSSRRVDGRARVTITTRLRTKPCSGNVHVHGLGGRAHDAHDRARAELVQHQEGRARCASRSGTRIRVGAKFNGNGSLKARSARTVSYRVR